MTNSDLSDEQVSRWIAEKLEPPSTLCTPLEYVNAWGYNKGTQCWRTTRPGEGILEWQPRDMVNDPAMTVMLLEKILTGDKDHIVSLNFSPFIQPSGEYYAIIHGGQPVGMNFKLGRAVAEAFMLANGFISVPREASGIKATENA